MTSNNKILSLIVAFGLLFFTCKMEEPDVITASTYPVSGEWWVRYFLNDAEVSGGYIALLTYNTASDKGDSIWVDDAGDFWNEAIKIKSSVDVANRIFSTTNSVNINDTATVLPRTSVTLINGKVLLGATTTTGGNKSDSIYVEFQYSNDPGNTYVAAGYRRTGFYEDEH